jgi:hypothetical protein
MLPRLARALVIVTLTISLGAHWAVLQSVAWTGMLVTYVKQAGISQGISMTFDGRHPCCLCKAIQKGKAEERKQRPQAAPTVKDLKLNLPPSALSFDHPPHPAVSSFPSEFYTGWSSPPELPPPEPAPR